MLGFVGEAHGEKAFANETKFLRVSLALASERKARKCRDWHRLAAPAR